MNPVFTIMHALKYLQQNTPPRFRDQGRIDAMDILSGIYKQMENEYAVGRANV